MAAAVKHKKKKPKMSQGLMLWGYFLYGNSSKSKQKKYKIKHKNSVEKRSLY